MVAATQARRMAPVAKGMVGGQARLEKFAPWDGRCDVITMPAGSTRIRVRAEAGMEGLHYSMIQQTIFGPLA